MEPSILTLPSLVVPLSKEGFITANGGHTFEEELVKTCLFADFKDPGESSISARDSSQLKKHTLLESAALRISCLNPASSYLEKESAMEITGMMLTRGESSLRTAISLYLTEWEPPKKYNSK